MTELFGWLLILPFMWWSNASVPGLERSEFVFETTPGMEAQVAAVLEQRIRAAGLHLEDITPGQGGRITARMQLPFYQDEVVGALTADGVFGLHSVIGEAQAECPATPSQGQSCLIDRDSGLALMLDATPILDGSQLANAEPAFDYNGLPRLNFQLSGTGTRAFCAWTSEHVGETMAIVLDGQILTAPRIQTPICGGAGQITGNFTVEETQGLAASLLTAPLPAPVAYVERTPLPPPERTRVPARDFPGPPRKL